MNGLRNAHDADKELCLDMSDFNQPSHNFAQFIQNLTDPDQKLKFEEPLFFVRLPDLNYVQQPCPHAIIRNLFDWLYMKGVRTIEKLYIPDNATNPLSDELVKDAILDRFNVQKLDWRKLDVNMDLLTSSKNAKYLTDLELYSSGNWSVLYHWVRPHGLPSLPVVRNVSLNLQPAFAKKVY
jgi:hypothetical protein